MANRHTQTIWTVTRLARAEKLWGEGMSASLIAETIGGLTRNAVIGMRGRKQWSRHGQNRLIRTAKPAGRPPKLRDPARLLNRHNTNPSGYRGLKPRPPIPKRSRRPEVPLPPTARMICVMELDTETCRWPVGPETGVAQKFCGADKPNEPSISYCPYHVRLAYQPAQARPSRGALSAW